MASLHSTTNSNPFTEDSPTSAPDPNAAELDEEDALVEDAYNALVAAAERDTGKPPTWGYLRSAKWAQTNLSYAVTLLASKHTKPDDEIITVVDFEFHLFYKDRIEQMENEQRLDESYVSVGRNSGIISPTKKPGLRLIDDSGDKAFLDSLEKDVTSHDGIGQFRLTATERWKKLPKILGIEAQRVRPTPAPQQRSSAGTKRRNSARRGSNASASSEPPDTVSARGEPQPSADPPRRRSRAMDKLRRFSHVMRSLNAMEEDPSEQRLRQLDKCKQDAAAIHVPDWSDEVKELMVRPKLELMSDEDYNALLLEMNNNRAQLAEKFKQAMGTDKAPEHLDEAEAGRIHLRLSRKQRSQTPARAQTPSVEQNTFRPTISLLGQRAEGKLKLGNTTKKSQQQPKMLPSWERQSESHNSKTADPLNGSSVRSLAEDSSFAESPILSVRKDHRRETITPTTATEAKTKLKADGNSGRKRHMTPRTFSKLKPAATSPGSLTLASPRTPGRTGRSTSALSLRSSNSGRSSGYFSGPLRPTDRTPKPTASGKKKPLPSEARRAPTVLPSKFFDKTQQTVDDELQLAMWTQGHPRHKVLFNKLDSLARNAPTGTGTKTAVATTTTTPPAARRQSVADPDDSMDDDFQFSDSINF